MVRLPTPEEDAAWTPYGNGKAECAQLTIECKPRDDKGRHLVTAKLGALVHKHRFDCDSQFHRRQFREAVVGKFNLPEDAHGEIEGMIISASEAADTSGPSAVANVVSMADVEAKKTKWHWEDYIPACAITVFSSDPGEGKSTILTDLIARNSRGHCPPPHTSPDGTFACCNSLMIQGEDDPERTVKPRLLAAGADVSRVHLLRSVTVCDEARGVQLPMDLPIIERVITEHRINLVGVDVLAAFTEPGVSLNDDAAMRRLFNPMTAVAERTQSTWVLIGHLNKKSNTPAMYRAGGSIAINGAARAAFTVGPHPDDPTEKVFAAVKHNLGPRPASLSYRIEAHKESSRIVWGGAVDLTAGDVLNQHEPGKGGKVETAKAIITDILETGPRGENEVRTACEQAGVSKRTYWRARKEIGVRAEKSAFQGEWLLSMPSANGVCHEEF